METHLNAVHLGKKDFKCDICDQAFTQTGNLKRHVNSVHTNISNYSCDLCDYSLYYRSNLERHFNLQTGEPYKGLAGAAVSPVLIAS
jgi:KRAB domain-containing zinc finger protein